MFSLRHLRGLAIAVVASAITAWPSAAQAQADYDHEDNPALVFYAQGGAYKPARAPRRRRIRGLPERLQRGRGHRLPLQPLLRRARELHVRPRRGSRRGLRDAHSPRRQHVQPLPLRRRHPAPLSLGVGATPYAFIGAGGVTVQRDIAGNGSNFTKRAGKVGLGVSYQLPGPTSASTSRARGRSTSGTGTGSTTCSSTPR